MKRFTLGTLGLGLLSLAFAVGCNPGYAAKDTVQGKELESILHQQRKIEVSAPSNLPLAFQPVEIEKQTDEHGTNYRAVAVWRLSTARDAAHRTIREPLVQKHPELADRDVKRVQLYLLYKDQQGNPCGGDSVEVDMTSNEGRIILPTLGKDGSPHSIVATVTSVTLAEREVTVSVN